MNKDQELADSIRDKISLTEIEGLKQKGNKFESEEKYKATMRRVNGLNDLYFVKNVTKERDTEIAKLLNTITVDEKLDRKTMQIIFIKLMRGMGYSMRDWLLLFGPFKEVDVEDDVE